ncbi:MULTISPECIES: quinone-dependent dihydroorotate dehydrogenase [Legionella]|uniref:Dihydroorotate dehydrogenase (quinone) n=1 Tax=Legionella resiliens TaxID=2905958 RepID=A0ABS8X5V2_9GAMM|nr:MULTISPECIES: quinone-dependent dihydroorotate dehydrogenase [unclassified Legionella]MCE0723375.1 quinone-dependent dihydroorotate dehydrogenase [Legionella sp. 9fVS26]MCE3532528.1 quinone-dependent dihydroorotate dehydrogenase [Legionella sp. 8cVS16]QLZ68660.1 quinone-dependent dihydroorotate dehydrogenase [Legionella sp. PC1000]
MYSMLRPLLFSMDPESAHTFSLSALHYVPEFCFKKAKPKPTAALGLQFPHVVGLAAGLDKNGEHLDALAKLGFSFIELGTVTPRPQIGNPKPRLFRLPGADAIINRMGFNNQGVDALVNHVKKAHYKGILGINIGKNKETSLEHAAEDYIHCLRKVYEYASYVTINISSPNTPDLRQLQQKEYFANLLSQIQAEQIKLSDTFQRHVPLVIKISPDEAPETLKQMTEVILNYGIEGIIATNTTCSRNGVSHLPYAEETGGLSGKPVWELSTQCLRLLKHYVGNDVTLIGVGGIDNCRSAQAKLDAGASLIQVYTGLIYQGPGLVYELAKGLK